MNDFKREDIKTALECCSIDYNGDYSVDSLVAVLEQSSGNDVKNFLKQLNIYDKTIKLKSQNIEYLKNTISIEGNTSKDVVVSNNDSTDTTDETASTNSEPTPKTIPVPQSTPQPTATPNGSQNNNSDINFPTKLDSAKTFFDTLYNGNNIQNVGNGETIYYDISSNNQVYENCSITKDNDIYICFEHEINTDICILVNVNHKVLACGKFEKGPNGYNIVAKRSNIDFDVISHETRFKVIFTDTSGKWYCGNITLNLKKIPISDKTLCIDFGTSNTTMGYCDSENQIQLVKFHDVTKASEDVTPLFPTILYVKNIDENKNIEYLFGYDAKKVLLDNDYIPVGSIFFELKRWIISLDDYEKVHDESDIGNSIEVKHSELISAYLKELIKIAEEYFHCKFKKLHFSAPVKLKNKFIQYIQDKVFKAPDYEVVSPKESLDEGIAIIYDYISAKIKEADNDQKFQNKPEETIMIIDCGGGTTDLASCKYSFEKKSTGYDLNIETKFENGNSNFGGNNITYKIFQLLKIKLADYFAKQSNTNKNDEFDSIYLSGVSELMNSNENDMLNSVDDCIDSKKPLDVYKELDIQSKNSEEILPTDFGVENSVYTKTANSKRRTERNFHYLWQLAEEVKIAFFDRTDTVVYKFEGTDNRLDDKTILIASKKNLYFYIKNPNGAGLTKSNIIPDIQININEISALLRPYIYWLLSNLFIDNNNPNNKYIDLNGYDHVRFSGQSCKINLFQNLLKEFIPGHKLRTHTKQSMVKKHTEDLKLKCINGSIAYIRDKETQVINPKIKIDVPTITYDVKISRANNTLENTLLKGTNLYNDNGNYISTNKLNIDEFKVSNSNITVKILNTVGYTYEVYHFNTNIDITSKEDITLDELKERIKRNSYIGKYTLKNSSKNLIELLMKDIENVSVEDIPDKEKLLVFLTPNSDGYGFILYQLIKKDKNGADSYSLTSSESYMFEDKISSKSFFNGKNNENLDY